MRRHGIYFAVLFGALIPLSAQAAGVTVSPAFQDVVLTQAMNGKDITVTLTNQSSVGLNFALSSADFGTLDETGGVAFLGTPATELEHRYGLVSWLTLDRNTVFLPAAGSKEILVHIDNRPSLAPGGHYAALLATAVSDSGVAPADPKVKLHQVIASLILVRKDGGAQPGLDLTGFEPQPKNWLHLPSRVQLRFHDAGNVHVVPHGTLSLTDASRKQISKGIINEDSVAVFPQSYRRMTSSLLSIRHPWLPGRYTLTANYHFDGDNTFSKESVSFWYLGNVLTALLTALILVLSVAILWVLRKIRHRP
jgi:hypothetical protein